MQLPPEPESWQVEKKRLHREQQAMMDAWLDGQREARCEEWLASIDYQEVVPWVIEDVEKMVPRPLTVMRIQ